MKEKNRSPKEKQVANKEKESPVATKKKKGKILIIDSDDDDDKEENTAMDTDTTPVTPKADKVKRSPLLGVTAPLFGRARRSQDGLMESRLRGAGPLHPHPHPHPARADPSPPG